MTQQQPQPGTSAPAPAWYPDPSNPSMLRWFDGVQYTEHVAPNPGARSLGDDVGMRMLLPVGRSGWAIAAGYAGLFAFIVFPAPIALILSGIAIRDLKRHPERHGWGRAWFGMVTGVVGTAILRALLLRWSGRTHVPSTSSGPRGTA